ncbi:hypothetical protein LH935_14920 [Gordonia polyisoprenivorans]|uniref:hypothetical protein n=1 Tax=Gordonia polyisoprenivorans TaxID=84595 RepID=UPI0022346609|nr:hypothetical protein LH935_14920 [Gordonia polyisoprenivorans]
MKSRWERERSAWLMAHSRPGGTLRRRADVLARDARRSARAGAGVSAAALQDEVTPPLLRRLTVPKDHGRRWPALLIVVVTGVALAPAIVLGQAIYRALDRVSPRIGRLWWWPWLLIAVLAIGARWTLTDWPVLGYGLHFDRHFPVTLLSTGGLWAWLCWQLSVAPLVVALEIRSWGWMGVPSKAVAPPDRNKDGSFRRIKDKHRRKLDPLAGIDDADYRPPSDEVEDLDDELDSLDDELDAFDPDTDDCDTDDQEGY